MLISVRLHTKYRDTNLTGKKQAWSVTLIDGLIQKLHSTPDCSTNKSISLKVWNAGAGGVSEVMQTDGQMYKGRGGTKEG